MNFLFELGTEELPAIPFLKELPNVLNKWQNALEEVGLDGEFKLDYTPRRIVISGQMQTKAKDLTQEFIGAPKSIALTPTGEWSTAAVKFAQKCGIGVEELEFREVKGKEVLYKEVLCVGQSARVLLPSVVAKFALALNFGRSMRWGSGEFEFIRPVRNVILMLEEELVECEVCGVKSRLAFLPHRKFGFEAVEFKSSAEYFSKLAQNGVILRADERREKILQEFKRIESNSNLTIELDEDLLDEVVAITEFPTAILGAFEEEFLSVPNEAIILSMKENQRYFPLFKNGKLANNFVAVSNAICEDFAQIVAGNERVLRARLSDAEFFYKQDLNAEFSAQKLKNINFMAKLGSVYDKEVREAALAEVLGEIYGVENKAELKEAVMLSKADLTTAMVYEFTELQGVMGSYYAKAFGKSEQTALAIKEQYLPRGDKDGLPTTKFSAVVALASKFDTLLGLFSVGELPSGTKDPYGLRRAANGVLRIIKQFEVKFDLRKFLQLSAAHYAAFETEQLERFILERLASLSGANASVVNAVLNGSCREILRLFDAIAALDEIVKKSDFRENFVTFKRIANILKETPSQTLCEARNSVKEELFESEVEANLWREFSGLKLDLNQSKAYLQALFGLKERIDAFFEGVMINAQNALVKQNRICLLGAIYAAFLEVADIKEISA